MREQLKQSFEETPQNPPTGLETLDSLHNEEYPQSNLVNHAMTLDVTLRHTKNAVATGRDVSVLQTPSQELLTDIVLSMPVGVKEPTKSGQQLFDALVCSTGVNEKTMTEDLISFTRAIQSAMSPYSILTNQERLELSMNIEPFARGLSYSAQRVIDGFLDQTRFGHEGGNIDSLHPDIYREFADRDYIKFMMSVKRTDTLSGLTRQVAMKLMKEAEWLLNRDIETSNAYIEHNQN